MVNTFDRIPHNKLLRIIENVDINDDILLWLKSYLNNKTKPVVVNTAMLQCSVLGPILFIMYINDLP